MKTEETRGEQEALVLFKALADQTRLDLLRALLDGPLCVGELAARFQLAESTVCFHLKKLEAAQLVAKRRNQYYQVYALAIEALQGSLYERIARWPDSAAQKKRAAQGERAKVLRAFFKGATLLALPRQWKKQLIVLNECAKDFAPGRVYEEEEVNALLSARHADYCTLRRLLIAEGFMSREDGRYTLLLRREDETREKTMEKQTRRERIRAVAQQKDEAGLLAVTNRRSGRVLWVACDNLRAGLNRQHFLLKQGLHSCPALQADYQAQDGQDIVVEVLERIVWKEEPGFSSAQELAALIARRDAELKEAAPGAFYNEGTVRELWRPLKSPEGT